MQRPLVDEWLEQIEDLLDGEAVDAVLAALADGSESRVPFARRTRNS